MARGSTLFLDSMSVVMIIKADRHNIGSKNVSSNFFTIIVLIYMQLWILHVNNKRKLKSGERGTCAYVLGFSPGSKLIYLTIRGRSWEYARKESKWIIIMCSSLPYLPNDCRALRFWLWFGAHSPMWLEWTSWAKTQFPGDCRVSASGKTFLFIWHLTFSSLTPVGETEIKRVREFF